MVVHRVLAEDIKGLGVETLFDRMSDDTAVFCTSLGIEPEVTII